MAAPGTHLNGWQTGRLRPRFGLQRAPLLTSRWLIRRGKRRTGTVHGTWPGRRAVSAFRPAKQAEKWPVTERSDGAGQPRRLCRPHWARKRTMCRGRLCPFFVFDQKTESTHVQFGFIDYTVVFVYRNCSREGIRSASYVCDGCFLRPVIMRFYERKIAMIFWLRVPLR